MPGQAILSSRRTDRRRAVVAVQVVVVMFVLIGFAALTVDVGVMYNVRADLQRSADAAALAGAAAYATDKMLQIRQGADGYSGIYEVVGLASGQVNTFAGLNPSLGVSSTYIEPNDIRAGWIDVTSGTNPLQPGVAPDSYNALQVTARRTSDGANGPIELLFANIFGCSTSETSASAVAVYDDRVGGFDPGAGPGYLLPFTVHRNYFTDALVNGPDSYGFDANDKTVTSAPDGIREFRLFPNDSAPGNFGLLNIGTLNQGVDDLRVQIENGVTPEDLEGEIGTSVLTFFDEDGDSVTHDITGSPGLDVSLESSLDLREGDVVAFLLHDQVVEGGANSVYTVTDIRFGRVMDLRLQGAVFNRGLWVQPFSYAGPGVVLNPAAPATNGLAGRIVLVR